MADDDQASGYVWEAEYERTWENLKEDAQGSLQAAVDDVVHRAKRRKLLERATNVRLGMMRHLYVVIDFSKAMEDQDLKPSRKLSTLKLLEHFIEEYFDQNPISQLGIMITCNKRAEKITEIGGNPRRHVTALQNLAAKPCVGEPSLQNAVDLSCQSLKHMPSHASREILIIFGSLTTCDPGDIFDSIKTLKENQIRCSVIGLAAEVYICKEISHATKGQYNVILNEANFKDILASHVTPPPAVNVTESSIIKMGFPHQERTDAQRFPSMCMCHLDTPEGPSLSTAGYLCPQCSSKYCELPVECRACGLTLVSAPHLARSYHHLFPLATFQEVKVIDRFTRAQFRYCYACQKFLGEAQAYKCERCERVFCVDCDVFIHESLHSCPGCASSRLTQLAQISNDLMTLPM